ncbi:hypothetical protein SAMN05216178_6903 [Pseudomonas saponiphila]|jgi:hypothetical protein|uniref:Uncharacterized protein n=1 Tax=Pseudomonas saponiphila TaxID=556534 RepID=A0A1H5A026_9PSED|nr:hypothetical protein [Pseudomonas saponiphila]SED35268.1 hypothetical protein SAMN05216178_6903 [Pseudomonas saponiphila]
MYKTYTGFAIAVIAAAVLTLGLIITQKVGFASSFTDGIDAMRGAVGGVLLLAAAWYYQSMNTYKPVFRIGVVWPFALAMVWDSFFSVLEAWGRNTPHSMDVLFERLPELESASDMAWYASDWMYAIVLVGIIVGGFAYNLTRDEF